MTAPHNPGPAPQGAHSPLERLRALRAEGRLAADWPAVPPLLAELVDSGDRADADVLADLSACGHLLATVDTGDVLARHPDVPLITAVITGHGTLAQLTAPLTAELARHGLLTRPVIGEYGAYLRDLTEPGGELAAVEADVTLCLLDAGAVFDELPLPWGPADVTEACARLTDRIRAITTAHAASGHGTLVLNTLPLLTDHLRQLVDERRRMELGATWREFNARLLRLASDQPHVAVVDLDPLIAAGGPVADARMTRYARAPFGVGLLAAYAREVGHIVRARRGMAKKCLVLDLDNTLWGGVLGDDGPRGIAVGGDLRGEPYTALQRVVKQLAAQGVLLAVSSRNERDAVLDVLREHPGMTLREADFVRVEASWEPKDTHLAAVAEALGIGAESMVLADDTPAERALIRARLPAAAVVALTGEPALHVERLLADGWFTTPRLTTDDRERTARYRDTAARHALRQRSGSYERYLRDLGLRVELAPPRPDEWARIAQLSLRTNQFNLTGERVSEQTVAAAAAAPDRLVLAVHVTDRFGDNGLVGALLARRASDGLHLDTFLLSCRVLARGVEQGVVAAVLRAAADDGLPAVHARYRPTPKNARAAAFYPSLGFWANGAAHGAARGTQTFRHDLADLPAVPGHLTLDLRLGDPAARAVRAAASAVLTTDRATEGATHESSEH
ncbi:HAD-IIIC family phosphatase [Streptomyces beihaiensis]|uniref:HAD-IIIC family phosphatase n=1 Tax=Streptomyces beihaiensis TaxID=2984495 RepID=A0ABT3TWF0_9ACTN|nr:HAD-IIIC family phosphatase [Streptomyces beihaiensis]MCX3061382.1 HAD-IIIC family phosphatase [Streptomyces beihaiensis]